MNQVPKVGHVDDDPCGKEIVFWVDTAEHSSHKENDDNPQDRGAFILVVLIGLDVDGLDIISFDIWICAISQYSSSSKRRTTLDEDDCHGGGQKRRRNLFEYHQR
jgi:hypothetical protein